MQRCNLSDGTEVIGKGNASSITLFLSSAKAQRITTLSGNQKTINLGGRGLAPGSQVTSQFIDVDSVADCQALPNPIQLAKAVFLVIQVLPKFERCVLISISAVLAGYCVSRWPVIMALLAR